MSDTVDSAFDLVGRAIGRSGLRAFGVATLAIVPAVYGCGGGDGPIEPNPGTPPSISVSGPSSGVTGEQLSYSANVSEPDGDNVSVSWQNATGNGTTATATFSQPGQYDVIARASDKDGFDADTVNVMITQANAPPSFTDLQEQDTPVVGQPLELVATASDPDGDQLNFDFAGVEGASADSVRNNRFYVTPTQTSFTVTGRVEDTAGNADEYSETFSAEQQRTNYVITAVRDNIAASDPSQRRGADNDITLHLTHPSGADTTVTGTGRMEFEWLQGATIMPQGDDNDLDLHLLELAGRYLPADAKGTTMVMPEQETVTATLYTLGADWNFEMFVDQGGIWSDLGVSAGSDRNADVVLATPRLDVETTVAFFRGGWTEPFTARRFTAQKEGFYDEFEDQRAALRASAMTFVPAPTLVKADTEEQSRPYISVVDTDLDLAFAANETQIIYNQLSAREAAGIERVGGVWYIRRPLIVVNPARVFIFWNEDTREWSVDEAQTASGCSARLEESRFDDFGCEFDNRDGDITSMWALDEQMYRVAFDYGYSMVREGNRNLVLITAGSNSSAANAAAARTSDIEVPRIDPETRQLIKDGTTVGHIVDGNTGQVYEQVREDVYMQNSMLNTLLESRTPM